jgi:hypothetical protein
MPSVKMKVFQWSKIPPRKLKDTIWGEFGEEDQEIPLEYKVLEELFAAKATRAGTMRRGTIRRGTISMLSSSDGNGGGVASGLEEEEEFKPKPGSVTVIDGKRAQNIGNERYHSIDSLMSSSLYLLLF